MKVSFITYSFQPTYIVDKKLLWASPGCFEHQCTLYYYLISFVVGLIFLWVTGRAMELGRECLKLWGYDRVDEIIWVKTNQLQRIIRTGRTGHWINHGKEHCLVGLKGKDMKLNRGLDCDVIVAEVRATSHKPDEIYGIIERLSPGTRYSLFVITRV